MQALAGLASLQDLSLTFKQSSAWRLDKLAPLSALTALRTLDVYGATLTNYIPPIDEPRQELWVAHLPWLPQLTSLSLRSCGGLGQPLFVRWTSGGSGSSSGGSALRMPRLRSLRLWHLYIAAEEVTPASLGQLEALDLCGCGLAEPLFALLPRLPHLTHLVLLPPPKPDPGEREWERENRRSLSWGEDTSESETDEEVDPLEEWPPAAVLATAAACRGLRRLELGSFQCLQAELPASAFPHLTRLKLCDHGVRGRGLSLPAALAAHAWDRSFGRRVVSPARSRAPRPMPSLGCLPTAFAV